MINFNSELLARRLQKIKPERQLAFGLSIAERMMPNYVIYSHENKGDISLLRLALDTGWNILRNNSSKQAVKELEEKCIVLLPDPDEPINTHILSSTANDTVATISIIMNFIETSDFGQIIQVPSFAFDIIDLYVQKSENLNPNDSTYEQKIVSHPLMQRELLNQESDLQILEQHAMNPSTAIELLYKQWHETTEGSLGIK